MINPEMSPASAQPDALNRLQAMSERFRWWLSSPVLLAALGLTAFAAKEIYGPSGMRDLAIWMILVMAAGFVALALSLAAARPILGTLLAAAAIGGAAQLYVTQPLWYPELFLPPRSKIEAVMYGIIALQGIVATLVVAVTINKATAGKVARAIGGWRLFLFVVLSGLFTVSIMNYLRLDEIWRYPVQVLAGTGLVLVNLMTALAIFRHLPEKFNAPRILWAPASLAIISGITSAVLAWTAFERMAHVSDEVVYMIQARIFAAGALWAPALPEAVQPAFEFFQLDFQGDRWFSVLAPGWPAVLAIGEFFGVPWLVNPLLSAASVLLFHDFLRRMWDERTAWLGCFLLALSPWHMAMGASLMTHSLTLFLSLVAGCCLVRIPQKSTRAKLGLAMAAGLAMGWVFLARPLDGLAIGGAIGGLILLSGKLGKVLPQAAFYALGCGLTGGLVFLYNATLTGDPLLAPMAAYFDRTWVLEGFANRVGFGPEIGPPGGFGHMELWTPGHSPVEALVNTLNNVNALHIDLFGWGFGSLAFIWAFLLLGGGDRRDSAMWAILFAVMLTYGLYWFAGSFYIGARYWYLAIVPLVTLTARGAFAVSGRLELAGIEAAGNRLTALIVLFSLFGLIVFTSYRGLTRYHNHRGYKDDFRHLAVAAPKGEFAPVFLIEPTRQIGSALFFNDPWLRPERPLFAIDLGEDSNAEVIAAFPNRPVVYIGDDIP